MTNNQTSILAILGFVGGFVGLCLAAPYINDTLSLLVTVAIVVRIPMFMIQAAVTSDQRRALAVGFLIPALTYLGIVWHFDEFRGHSDTSLPTTRIVWAMSAPSSHNAAPRSSAEGKKWERAWENHRAFIILAQFLIAYAAGKCGMFYARGLLQTTTSAPEAS